MDGCGYIELGMQGVPASANAHALPGHDATLSVGCDNTDATFWGTIRQRGEKAGDGIGALTKTGSGVFTLHGGQTYTGPDHGGTRDPGSSRQRGGRRRGETRRHTPRQRPYRRGVAVGGRDIRRGADRPHGKTAGVEGPVSLDGNLVVTTPKGVVFPAGRKWTVLEAAGGVSGNSGRSQAGYQVNIVDGGKKVEVQKL